MCAVQFTERREEGIVLKSLTAPWQPGDRSGSWVKCKGDYLKATDIDALIIGAWCVLHGADADCRRPFCCPF